MNYTQSFDEFASSLGPTDIALYAGAAIVAWVLFKDKLNPVTSLVSGLVDRAKLLLKQKSSVKPDVSTATKDAEVSQAPSKEDVFFELVTSWKKTRDLAVKAECVEAIKVADQMFPFLSPVVCNKDKV